MGSHTFKGTAKQIYCEEHDQPGEYTGNPGKYARNLSEYAGSITMHMNKTWKPLSRGSCGTAWLTETKLLAMQMCDRKTMASHSFKTIQHILARLQRKMLDTIPDTIKFLDSSQSGFHELRCTCDTVYRDLHSQGNGANVRHMPTFSPDNKNKF